MRLLIRTDGNPAIGGGHVMRCLTLAEAARSTGHTVRFVVAGGDGAMDARISAAGFDAQVLEPEASTPEAAPAHAAWLSLSWQSDAEQTAEAVRSFAPDWLVWDHYGLDKRWVGRVREAAPDMRVMAIDDLDDRPLGSDFVLDQAKLAPRPRDHRALAELNGPTYALLRPEFAKARATALGRRTGDVRYVLVTPGLMDAANLAPLAVRMLDNRTDMVVEVAMGSNAQSLPQVSEYAATHGNLTLTLDADDMAARMTAADICIGAGGMTSWERCCLGLPTLAVAVAHNQEPGLQGLAARGAIHAISLSQARDPAIFGRAFDTVCDQTVSMSAAAADICDGQGASRVLAALTGAFRPVGGEDARQLFAWRNQPHIRAASLTHAPLVWDSHVSWVEKVTHRTDGLWFIYMESGRDLGHLSVVPVQGGTWQWSFYIGAADAPKGAGQRMLALAVRQLFNRSDILRLRAEVLPDNAQSVTLHRRLGFRQVAHGTGRALVFILDKCDVATLPDAGSHAKERS